MLFPSAILSALALFSAAQSVSALPAKPFPMARMESGELSIPAERDNVPAAHQVYERSSAKFRGGKKRLISDSIPTFSDNGDVQVFKGGAEGKRGVAPIPDTIPTSSENGVLKVFAGGNGRRSEDMEERGTAPIPDTIPTSSENGVLKVFTGGSGRRSEVDERGVAPIPDTIPTSSENGVLKVFTGGAARRSVEEERDVAPINDNVPTSSENGVLKVFVGPGVAARRALEDVVERFFQDEFAPVEKKMNGKTKRAAVFGNAAKIERGSSAVPKRRLPKQLDDDSL